MGSILNDNFCWPNFVIQIYLKGNICGRGVFSDHPMLLMFDMTQCLNPAILVEGCLTPKVMMIIVMIMILMIMMLTLRVMTTKKNISKYNFVNVQVCVNRCPDESYSPLFNAETGTTSETEIKRKMKDFCRMDKMEEFNKFSVKKLVQEGICPPWQALSQTLKDADR